MPDTRPPARYPMPSRPSLPPPVPPEGAKRMAVKTLAQAGMDIVKTHRHSKRWLIFLLLTALVLLLVVGVLIAKTGVYQIPFLSNSMYHQRPVTRVVRAEAMPPKVLLDRLNQGLQVTTSTQAGDVRISFTEQDMTGALKGAFESSLKRQGVSVDASQVVVTPSGLEVTAFIRNETMSVHLYTRVVPVLDSIGKVSFDVKEVYLGDLPVPPSSLPQIERIAFGSEIGSFEARAGAYGLKAIQLKDGSVDLVFSTSTKSGI